MQDRNLSHIYYLKLGVIEMDKSEGFHFLTKFRKRNTNKDKLIKKLYNKHTKHILEFNNDQ